MNDSQSQIYNTCDKFNYEQISIVKVLRDMIILKIRFQHDRN